MRFVRAFLGFKCRLNRAEYAIVFVGYLLLPTMFFLTESSTHANGYRIRKVTKVTLEELSKILDAVNAGLCRLFVSSMQLNTAPNPIPGLCAADELVGGFFRWLSGGIGLVSGGVFGRIAGREAAES